MKHPWIIKKVKIQFDPLIAKETLDRMKNFTVSKLVFFNLDIGRKQTEAGSCDIYGHTSLYKTRAVRTLQKF